MTGRPAPGSPGPRFPAPVVVAKLPMNTEEELRVSLDDLRGKPVVDLRIFATFTLARVHMPTKKGVSVGIERIPDLIEALSRALSEARHSG